MKPFYFQLWRICVNLVSQIIIVSIDTLYTYVTRFDKPSFDTQSYVTRYGDFKYSLYYSSLVDYAEGMKITASSGVFLSYNCVGE